MGGVAASRTEKTELPVKISARAWYSADADERVFVRVDWHGRSSLFTLLTRMMINESCSTRPIARQYQSACSSISVRSSFPQYRKSARMCVR